jgi:serine phosphatase RsbU (regulator of sigma subunit)
MKWSLRVKSILALCACVAVVLALALVVARRALRAIEMNLGSAYARNTTQYNKQRILTPVLREMALAERLADSEVTRRWLRNERSPGAKALFFAEAEGYRKAFADHSFFIVSAATRNYYFSDGKDALAGKPRYTVNHGVSQDAWFFNTMKSGRHTSLNVDPNDHLKVTKVWFNVKVADGGGDLGLVGTGLTLDTFLRRFIADRDPGVTPMILNRDGAIQVHPDPTRIDYGSINDSDGTRHTLYSLLTGADDAEVARAALRRAEQEPGASQLFWATLDHRPQLFAVSFLPELGWHVVTAIDLKTARLVDGRLWKGPLMAGGALLILLTIVITVAINRLVLTPLLRLTHSARAVAAGDYSVSLPPSGRDEIGELTRAFGAMASQVRSHTEDLENTVRRRTAELRATNEKIAEANQTMADSIRYAAVIQTAILPDEDMEQSLANRHFVLWRPRDVVGGDYYVFRSDERGCLVGIVDCAGHGVPGAFMTMAAHTALEAAMDTLGLCDPAALLTEMDRRIRATLDTGAAGAHLAANMDAGLAYMDRERGTVTYAGAKVSLYWSDGHSVRETKGCPRAIAGKRRGAFVNHTVAGTAVGSFYLTTDGYLDQAGGAMGYSLGNARFGDIVQRAAAAPLDRQRAIFAEELEAWQGDRPQRDDITVLAFDAAGDHSRSTDGPQRPLSAARNL